MKNKCECCGWKWEAKTKTDFCGECAMIVEIASPFVSVISSEVN